MKPEQENEQDVIFTYGMAYNATKAPENIKYYKALNKIEQELAAQNVYKGGVNNSGFTFEFMNAADKNIEYKKIKSGDVMQVLGTNDQEIDLINLNADGDVIETMQAKKGYHGTNKYKITDKYKNQTLVVDRGNKELMEYAEKIGLKVEESPVSKKSADSLTKAMRKEADLRSTIGMTDSANAPVTAKLYGMSKQLEAAHVSGVEAAKGGATFAAGISFGKNMYELIEGNVELREFLFNVGTDTAKATASSYVMGAAGSVVAGAVSESAIGTAVSQAASVVVATGVGQTLVAMGPVIVSMSAATGPMFLLGMAIGTGCAVCKSIHMNSMLSRQKLKRTNDALDQVLSCMKNANDDLEKTIKDTYGLWNRNFDAGYQNMLAGMQDNNLELFSRGLDSVMNVLDSNVLFHSLEEFDEFFYDEDAVLVL